MKTLARFIWNLSEFLHLPLGRFAPYIFKVMIGAKEMKRIYLCNNCDDSISKEEHDEYNGECQHCNFSAGGHFQ